MQIEQEVHDRSAVDAVEIPGRFIGKDQVGLLTMLRAMATR
jgi:hypothetical protein